MSEKLAEQLRAEISGHGPISFARFMECSLYDPQLGYYARPQNPTGRKGDFITSVSVGACFGHLLAEQIADYWQRIGLPQEFHVVEQGANDGQLMADVLERLGSHYPACAQTITPHFIESLESARTVQSARVPQAVQHPDATQLAFQHGVYFCNELVDAFPVQRVRWDGQSWQEIGVGLNADGHFTEVALNSTLAIDIPSTGLSEGYTTELCPAVIPWLQGISQCFAQGLWMIVDYGLTDSEYFAPHRHEGTLRGYQHHQMVTKNFLEQPGAMDLTTHVNWTRLMEAARAQGLAVRDPIEQMRFLTALAEPALKSMETGGRLSPQDLIWLRQFQTLTHPEQMGRKFQALLLTKGALTGKLRGEKFGPPEFH